MLRFVAVLLTCARAVKMVAPGANPTHGLVQYVQNTDDLDPATVQNYLDQGADANVQMEFLPWSCPGDTQVADIPILLAVIYRSLNWAFNDIVSVGVHRGYGSSHLKDVHAIPNMIQAGASPFADAVWKQWDRGNKHRVCPILWQVSSFTRGTNMRLFELLLAPVVDAQPYTQAEKRIIWEATADINPPTGVEYDHEGHLHHIEMILNTCNPEVVKAMYGNCVFEFWHYAPQRMPNHFRHFGKLMQSCNLSKTFFLPHDILDKIVPHLVPEAFHRRHAALPWNGCYENALRNNVTLEAAAITHDEQE